MALTHNIVDGYGNYEFIDRRSILIREIYHWDYDRELVIQYLRKGYCSKCSDCCKGYIPISVADQYDPHIPQQGGKSTNGKGIWIEVSHKNQRVFFKTGRYQACDKRCLYLNENDECASYLRRPLICQEFPLSPDNIVAFPQCSYTFTRIGEWTFNQLGINLSVKK